MTTKKRYLLPLGFLAVNCAFAAGPMFTIQDLGTVGGIQSRGNGINASGQVAGWYLTAAGAQRAFLWDGTTMHDLGDLGGGQSVANGINASGQVTGYSTLANGWWHPFVWNGTMHDLGVIGGSGIGNYLTGGSGINDAGNISGTSSTSDIFTQRAFFWNGTTMQDIGTLEGQSSFGTGINKTNQITGSAYVYTASTFSFQNHAFFWNGATMQDIGTLGRLSSFGTAVNDFGQVTGSVSGTLDPTTGTTHAFFWNGATMQDIGGLFAGNASASYGSGINNQGQIVGSAAANGFLSTPYHAFLWDGVTMWDLNNQIANLGNWTELTFALAINDNGQITGYGTIGGQEHAFLLTPVSLGGTIYVTTNLPAATFTITGAASYSGSGASFIQANAPAGTYTITFGTVAGYSTPASQTLALASGATIAFSGTYRPVLLVSPSTLLFQYAPGANASAVPQQLSISSATALPFTISSVTNPPGGTWLSLSSSAGTATSTGSNIAVSVSPNMPTGSYFATAVISAPGASNPVVNVPVSLVVSAIPVGQPTPGQRVRLTIVTNTSTLLNQASFTVVDAAGQALPDGLNVFSFSADVLPGPYRITYNSLPGYYTPLAHDVSLKPGSSPSLIMGRYRRLILVSFTGWDNAPDQSNCFELGGIGSGIKYDESSWATSTAGMIKLLYEIQQGPAALSVGADMAGFTFYSTDGNGHQLGDACSPDDATGATVADAAHAEAHAWIESQTVTPDDIVAVMGHSYGGNRARRFVDELDLAGIVVSFLATVDPIDWDKCNGKQLLIGCDQSQLSYPYNAAGALSFHQVLGQPVGPLTVPLKGYVLAFPATIVLEPDDHSDIDDDFIVNTNIKTALLNLINSFLHSDSLVP